MTTGTQMKRGKQYKGSYFVALTKFEDKYDINAAFSRNGLNDSLSLKREELGKRLEVVRVYNGVSCFAIRKLKETARELDAGKSVDLERIFRV